MIVLFLTYLCSMCLKEEQRGHLGFTWILEEETEIEENKFSGPRN